MATEMKMVMISQPMNNLSDNEIAAVRHKATEFLKQKGFSVADSWFSTEWHLMEVEDEGKRGVVQKPLFFLSKSLETMSLCDAVYFCSGWENTRGCRIEHDVAEAYGLEIMYEEEKEI